ncbi:MAG: YdiU family protein [Microthrixaceae bacterium]
MAEAGDGAPAAPLSGLERSFAAALPELCLEWSAARAPEPTLAALNAELAASLGLDPDALRAADGVATLAGNLVPPGAAPVAMGYAGHQFGHYSPRLGDGRALLLGELVGPGGDRLDVHLKGSGRTPFARGGDGRATIGPMLREYLIAEALHALGVPTTRSLAVVTTGEQVMRDGIEPGAVLTRIAAGHIRVGTFEYAARLADDGLVRRLADYSIQRHYPDLSDSSEPYRQLLVRVIDAQAALVARWMLVGFIHGVMNTDNMAISGEGIDYGPCAFMDAYHPDTVFSSIDHAGRYAFGNQPVMATWNLARFAETLVPLLAATEDAATEDAVAVATEELKQVSAKVDANWRAGMAAKLGLEAPHDADPSLFGELLGALQADEADWTGTFRTLADLRRNGADGIAGLPDALAAWVPGWIARLDGEGRPPVEVADAMDAVNPVHIPRNHLATEALDAAAGGDLGPFEALLAAVTNPFDAEGADLRYAQPAPPEFSARFRTFCGT